MVDVFISYSRQNKDKVRLLAERVEALGYQVWWDRDLPPHKSYGDVISEKIGEARAAIVVWSESAAGSQWVRAEADTAREQHKLIQTALDETRPPMPFNMLQFVSLADWQGEDDHHGWQKVRESLAELCPADSSGAAAPAAPATLPASPETPAKQRSNTALIITLAAIGGVTAVAVSSVLSGSSADDEEPVAANIEDEFPLDAVIADPEGFAYIRNAPAGSAAVVGRVMSGEIFYTREQNADWWQVVTEDGVHGFMDETQIVTMDEDGNLNIEEVADSTPETAQNAEEAMVGAQAEAMDDITEAMEGVSAQIEGADE